MASSKGFVLEWARPAVKQYHFQNWILDSLVNVLEAKKVSAMWARGICIKIHLNLICQFLLRRFYLLAFFAVT